MKVVGEGENHRVAVDIAKNRLYLYFRGEMMKYNTFKDLPKQVQEGCRLLSHGFTDLTDFREVAKLGLPDLVREVQQVLQAADVRKVAIVWSQDGFSKWVLDRSAEEVGKTYAEKRRNFVSKAEAEEWLDKS